MSCKKSTCKANSLLKQYGATVHGGSFEPAISLLGYILQIDGISQNILPDKTADWRYRSFESLLLDKGKFFKIEKTVTSFRDDFGNRFRYVANQQSKQNIYVEGVVLKKDGNAYEHAWIQNGRTGEITDVYLDGQCYFGIPFAHWFVDRYNKGRGIFSPEGPGIELLIRGLPQNAVVNSNLTQK